MLIQGFTSDDFTNSEEYRAALIHQINAIETEIANYSEIHSKASSPMPAMFLVGGIAAEFLSFTQASSDSEVNSLLGAIGLGCILYGWVYIKDNKSKLKASEHMIESSKEKLREAKDYYDYAVRHKDKDGDYIFTHGGKLGLGAKLYE